MDVILIFSFLLLAFCYLCSIIVSAYYVSVRGATAFTLLSKLLLALIVYALFTLPLLWVSGLVMFVKAHTQPPGTILRTRELMIGVGLLCVYVATGWLVCSFIVGHLLVRRSSNRDEPQ